MSTSFPASMDTTSPHGHPDARKLNDPPSQQRRRPFTATSHANFSPSPQRETRVNAQRRLQLRNSTFGTQLSAQRLGAQFSSIFYGNEEPQLTAASDRQHENRIPHRSLRGRKGSYSLDSRLGILNEISNSTHIPRLRKRASVPVYEDNPERPLLDRSPATPDSHYHDASSTIPSPLSPFGCSYVHDETSTMRLREVSGNEQRRSPSFSSPLSSITHKGRKKPTGTRQSTFEAAEYIEHIERQLEQVKQALHSPQSGKPIHEKMRTLKAENNQLKKSIQALESSFEARVKNSVEHMTAGEGELRRKIRCLEEDLRDRNVRIQELEYEHDQARLDQGILETLKATIERLEGEKQTLEEANRTIEKRNEVLTELLAFSPSKMHHGFELTSPLRNRGRLPRPASMMGPSTRFPSSPTFKQASRPPSMINSPAAVSPGGYFSPRNALELELEHPCDGANDADSGLGDSCSAKSPIFPSSRRSTLASQASNSPTAWGLPMPVSPIEEFGTARPTQKRKPRRFMTGSTQLKPLLLPSMAAEGAGITSPRSSDRPEVFEEPASIDQPIFAHDLERTRSSPRREVSEQSIDPTISFLSGAFEGSNLQDDECTTVQLGSSPPQRAYLEEFPFSSVDSFSLAVELEATASVDSDLIANIEDETGVEEECPVGHDSPERRKLFDSGQSHRDHPVFAEVMPAEDFQSSSATQERLFCSIEALMHSSPSKHKPLDSSPNPRKRRRTSSMFESDESSLAQLHDILLSHPDVNNFTSPSILRHQNPDRNKSLQPSDDSSRLCRPDLNPVSMATKAAHRLSASPVNSPKRLSRSTTPLEILQRQSVSSSPLAAVTIRSIYGTLSRYTTYIREFRRDPLALARRVIANAWCSNWKRFGKLSWWVLGIFLPGSRRDYVKAPGCEYDHFDAEAIAERFCRTEPRDASRIEPSNATPSTSPGHRLTRFDDQHGSYHTRGLEEPTLPVLTGSKESNPSLRKSLYLWGKFSVAIMLAISGAVWKGPEEMLKNCETRKKPDESPKRSPNRGHDTAQEDCQAGRVLKSTSDSDSHQRFQMSSEPVANVVTNGTSFDFIKTTRLSSNVFTFGATCDDNFWDENDQIPNADVNHCHRPDCGDDARW